MKVKMTVRIMVVGFLSALGFTAWANAPDEVIVDGRNRTSVPVIRAIAVAEHYAEGKATMVSRSVERGKSAYIVRVQNPYAHIDAVVDATTGKLLDSKTVSREFTSEGLSI